MRAGELRHRVKIQQRNVTQDSYGAPVETWTDVATVWAAIEPLRGREFFDAKQLQAEVDHRIRIRYRSGITPEMRIVWGSRIFDIQAVLEVEPRRELYLMCQEVV